ncbi:Trm112 family protein [Desulfovibrio sp.]|uniref:Trm112 family protein n=1 Tax=Desulfovibrio sp. TaxID=885 RepID=UPI0023CC1CBD|nr:Trm112 family protein [Desulfovibrio sp.]MDE7240942.1 glycine cleavage system protein H [Desulfovibrio sp.]
MNTEELLRLLACPKCLGELAALDLEGKTAGFACDACAVVYPVREQIPVMLVEEAIPREQWDRDHPGMRETAREGA